MSRKRRTDLRKWRLLSVCNISDLLVLNLIITYRPFSWVGLCHHACPTIPGECVLCLKVLPYFYNTQCSLDYLQSSTFLLDLDHIVSCFDKTTKLRFRNSDEPQFIKFGGARDNDPSCNIRFGQLKLMGLDVAKFFEPSVECIVNAVLEQCKVAHKPLSVRRSCLLYHPLS
jgi:hypothetical protein